MLKHQRRLITKNTVSEDELSKLNVTADPFVRTSEKAYYKEDYSDGNGLQKSDKDQEGEYTLGEILTKKIDDNKNWKFVCIIDWVKK